MRRLPMSRKLYSVDEDRDGKWPRVWISGWGRRYRVGSRLPVASMAVEYQLTSSLQFARQTWTFQGPGLLACFCIL